MILLFNQNKICFIFIKNKLQFFFFFFFFFFGGGGGGKGEVNKYSWTTLMMNNRKNKYEL